MTLSTNRIVVGVDPSAKKIALVATCPLLGINHAKPYLLYKRGETKQTIESLGRALDAMDDFIAWVDQVAPRGERYAWVEDPLVGRGGVTTTMKQAYVGGIIRASLVRAGFTVYGVNQSSWKKDVINNGSAQKADVRRVVKTAWPKIMSVIGDDGDLTDAAAITLYGGRVLAKTDALARLAAGPVQGDGPGVVVRPARVQRPVRHGARVLHREGGAGSLP